MDTNDTNHPSNDSSFSITILVNGTVARENQLMIPGGSSDPQLWNTTDRSEAISLGWLFALIDKADRESTRVIPNLEKRVAFPLLEAVKSFRSADRMTIAFLGRYHRLPDPHLPIFLLEWGAVEDMTAKEDWLIVKDAETNFVISGVSHTVVSGTLIDTKATASYRLAQDEGFVFDVEYEGVRAWKDVGSDEDNNARKRSSADVMYIRHIKHLFAFIDFDLDVDAATALHADGGFKVLERVSQTFSEWGLPVKEDTAFSHTGHLLDAHLERSTCPNPPRHIFDRAAETLVLLRSSIYPIYDDIAEDHSGAIDIIPSRPFGIQFLISQFPFGGTLFTVNGLHSIDESYDVERGLHIYSGEGLDEDDPDYASRRCREFSATRSLGRLCKRKQGEKLDLSIRSFIDLYPCGSVLPVLFILKDSAQDQECLVYNVRADTQVDSADAFLLPYAVPAVVSTSDLASSSKNRTDCYQTAPTRVAIETERQPSRNTFGQMSPLCLGLIRTELTFEATERSRATREKCGSFETERRQVTVAVIAFRGEEKVLHQWRATFHNYLNSAVGDECDVEFSLVALDFDAMYHSVSIAHEAAAPGSDSVPPMDFVFTNPVEFQTMYSTRPLLSVTKVRLGIHLNSFGTVLFTRRNLTVDSILECRDRVVCGVHRRSFGGWIVGLHEMIRRGIDPYKDASRVEFFGTHDETVYGVLAGKCDCGTIRTGTLEAMEAEGNINVEDVKLLHERKHLDFPYLISTDLYPEWTLSALPHVPERLAMKVALSLLFMNSSDAKSGSVADWAKRRGSYAGWSLPQNDHLPRVR
ncbi:unnamed protein product [Vitrella brassicaformis CCMP3155]|uniref:Uncharacterized protein n=1 Tax=Vitrella brassicaformis (strain CCMP3155) TaxID=1169540 RepID=A0A0G4GZG6_VITBC|nr:unnamed protein product [Vitrella brassicaformis CCMP3155]|eukprot:CEM36394.1 unnamed protein product [Vitrella brassicaformis CCMP3155]